MGKDLEEGGEDDVKDHDAQAHDEKDDATPE